MNNDSLFEAYIAWLEPQTGVDRQRRSYSDLLRFLWRKEFVWLVPNDDNRLRDGLDVRQEFLDEHRGRADFGPCSVLEVLVGLSRRLSFSAGGDPPGWAWQLLCNLGLDKMSDPVGRRKEAQVDEILERLIWRTYAPDGQGGFFPLAWPEDDQRKVELWYQMAAYVDEIHPEY
jgi:hypothetical protein